MRRSRNLTCFPKLLWLKQWQLNLRTGEIRKIKDEEFDSWLHPSVGNHDDWKQKWRCALVYLLCLLCALQVILANVSFTVLFFLRAYLCTRKTIPVYATTRVVLRLHRGMLIERAISQPRREWPYEPPNYEGPPPDVAQDRRYPNGQFGPVRSFGWCLVVAIAVVRGGREMEKFLKLYSRIVLLGGLTRQGHGRTTAAVAPSHLLSGEITVTSILWKFLPSTRSCCLHALQVPR